MSAGRGSAWKSKPENKLCRTVQQAPTWLRPRFYMPTNSDLSHCHFSRISTCEGVWLMPTGMFHSHIASPCTWYFGGPSFLKQRCIEFVYKVASHSMTLSPTLLNPLTILEALFGSLTHPPINTSEPLVCPYYPWLGRASGNHPRWTQMGRKRLPETLNDPGYAWYVTAPPVRD